MKENNNDNKKSLKELVEKAEEKEKQSKTNIKTKTSDAKNKSNSKENIKDDKQTKNDKNENKVVSLSDALKDNNSKTKNEKTKEEKVSNAKNNIEEDNETPKETKREKVKLDELIKKTNENDSTNEKGGVISFSEERNKAKAEVTKNKSEENKKTKEKAKQIEKEIKKYGGIKNNDASNQKEKIDSNKDKLNEEKSKDEEENLYLDDVDLAVLGVKHDKGPNPIFEYIKEGLITFGLIFVAIIILMILPVFNVNDLTITNIELLSEEEVKEAINYNKSKNFFHLFMSNPEKKLEALPQVKEVEAKFTFPNTLVIRIKEIKIAGYIPYLDEYIYIDSEGQIIEISNTKRDGIPLIEGLNFSSFKLGNKLETTNKQSLNTIIVITNVLSKYEITNSISSIDVTDSDNLRLYVENIEVDLGDIEDVDQKIRNAMEAISKLVDGAKGTLDVTSSTGRIYFKPAS